MKLNEILRSGDLVEVRTPDEILQTLDAEGALDQLPFMPEMLQFCGKRFTIARHVVKTCCYTGSGTNMRAFRTDDVVTLDGLRCSGEEHDDCPKGCMIFWREAWLRRIDDSPANARRANQSDLGRLRARLRTRASPNTFFCQASEILNATRPLSRLERAGKCISEVRAGNCTPLEMAHRIGTWLVWRIRRALFGEYARGHNQSTPLESLNLQPGELVEIKPMKEIRTSLNAAARNRGLYFSPDMRLLCGETRKVDRRLDKIIVDGTGAMREMHNTIYLEGSFCNCDHAAFGGCSRSEFVYWREIWLRRRGAKPAHPGGDSKTQLPA